MFRLPQATVADSDLASHRLDGLSGCPSLTGGQAARLVAVTKAVVGTYHWRSGWPGGSGGLPLLSITNHRDSRGRAVRQGTRQHPAVHTVDLAGVWDKVHEELVELKEAVASGDRTHAQEQMGDVLFTLVMWRAAAISTLRRVWQAQTAASCSASRAWRRPWGAASRARRSPSSRSTGKPRRQRSAPNRAADPPGRPTTLRPLPPCRGEPDHPPPERCDRRDRWPGR